MRRFLITFVAILVVLFSAMGVESLIMGDHNSILRQTLTSPVKQFIDGSRGNPNQVVVAALQADGPQVGDHAGGVVGVGGDDALGDPAVDVQTGQEPHQELGEESGHLIENVHGVGGGVHFAGLAAGRNLLKEALVKTLQGAFLLGVEEGQGFLAGIGEDFLHHKGRRNLVSLICILVGDEPVELRAQDNGL